MKNQLVLALAILLFACGCVQENTQTETTTTTTQEPGTTILQTTYGVTTTSYAITTTTIQQAGELEVHEWGVLLGQSLDTSYALLSAPTTLPDLPVVKEPVIYIHSEDAGSFDAKVVFRSGWPTESYPAAESADNSFVWENVQITGEDSGITYPSGILTDINNVDADTLQYRKQKSRSLFYEGVINYENKIRLIYNADKKEALIENKGSYPVYDLIVIVPSNYNKLLGKNIYSDLVPKIGAGETVTVPLRQVPAKVDYAGDLIKLGYARTEAQAFADIWEDIFQKIETGKGNLVYRLSQDEYDRLIELKITPEPAKTIRSLYVLVKLTGKDTPQPPVIGTGFGIYQGQNPVISEDDIVSYNKTNHVIKLTEDGLRVMRSKILYEEEDGKLVPKLGGLYLKAFSVRIDGVEIYSGTFWSSLSSSSNSGIVLLDILSIVSDDSVRIDAGYPGPSYYKGVDPRNNTKIMQYLRDKNKLVE
ncbi:MAG: hypothetical protein WAX07_09185 [Candidatus Altiarchaeia archaeon]